MCMYFTLHDIPSASLPIDHVSYKVGNVQRRSGIPLEMFLVHFKMATMALKVLIKEASWGFESFGTHWRSLIKTFGC